RVGIDRDHLRAETLITDRPTRELRRVAGTDFDVSGGVVQPEETVQSDGIETGHPVVVPAGLCRVRRVARDPQKVFLVHEEALQHASVRVTIAIDDLVQSGMRRLSVSVARDRLDLVLEIDREALTGR